MIEDQNSTIVSSFITFALSAKVRSNIYFIDPVIVGRNPFTFNFVHKTEKWYALERKRVQ